MYGLLREEIQDHILEKLQLLIDRRIIRGTFENGTEYTILAVVLNLEKRFCTCFRDLILQKRIPS